eukprot:CAMPEP_0170618332 /NCGR_PEP_ID=MMETSP0224-20130122/26902_1 /TAXON_ID=285029 /ORGANISM="Togula jolla, Strain CCCM 725" /LENGTH=65 /DNA_ID=CAMNT_0010944299 /DNA_START=83 /DNA_END=276 /DNA_ORIENTATION=-
MSFQKHVQLIGEAASHTHGKMFLKRAVKRSRVQRRAPQMQGSQTGKFPTKASGMHAGKMRKKGAT